MSIVTNKETIRTRNVIKVVKMSFCSPTGTYIMTSGEARPLGAFHNEEYVAYE